MKYRHREETIRGDSPYVTALVTSDGSEAKVTVHYVRHSVAKDVKTTTFGKLELGWLSLDELACAARTLSRALYEAKHAHLNHTNELMNGVREQLGA